MSVLPVTKLEQLQYFEAHQPVWAVAPTTIGLTAAAMTDLASKTANARKAYNDMLSARDAAKAATSKWYDMWGLMSAVGRDDIRLIKAFADAQANPASVYNAAQVEQPAPPGPSPIPGTPEKFNVSLNPASGELTLTWKCIGDGNAVYLVSRQFASETAPRFLGAIGAKSFTDVTLPTITGVSMPVSYFVTCQRGAQSGQMASVTIRFGAGGGGGGFAMVENAPTQPMKMAA